MTRLSPEGGEVDDDLVALFIAIALAQYEAVAEDDTAEYNRLFREMAAVELQLKNRPGDQRKALIPALDHPNAQVRLKAAFATLAVAPLAARRTLQAISDQMEYPEAADARGMLRALDEGNYKPT